MSSKSSLAGKVCLVTGATRGIGRGIAMQLGEAGATVYITGRTLKPKAGSPGLSLEEAAQEIKSRGGKCIPVQCDHSNDESIKKLFDRVQQEQNGQIDILVNNAYSAVGSIFENTTTKFWNQPINMWDTVNNVGLRNHYICSVYASKMMVPRKQGLIVNVSSMGGLRYLFNVPYGIGKEACDRMAADCAHELKKHNVAFVSLWPGAVSTETIKDLLSSDTATRKLPGASSMDAKQVFSKAETTEFAGKCIAHLANDPALMKKSGRILLTAELANEYGFNDVNGRQIRSMRCVKGLLEVKGHTWLAALTPEFVKIPFWMIHLASYKF